MARSVVCVVPLAVGRIQVSAARSLAWLAACAAIQTPSSLLANNTRFLLLTSVGQCRNLASYAMSAMLRRLIDTGFRGGDIHCWSRKHLRTRRLSPGRMYDASNWTYVGNSKGFSRSKGLYTDTAQQPKRRYVCVPLHRDERRLLRRDKGM